MSLYITKENQEMLWTLIHKTPQIHTYFERKPASEKTEWFKHVIQTFYARNQFRELSIPDLQQINKDTLAYMLQYVRPDSYGGQHTTGGSAWPTVKPTMESQFQTRQQVYTQMLEKPTPDSVDFGEKVEDHAISNMEELIEQHRRQREKELAEYAPPPLQPKETKSLAVEAKPENIRFQVDETSNHLEEKINNLESMVLELRAEVLSLREKIVQ